eukprot:5280153-Pleurochrysis_carterae.AAC.1
MRLLGLGLSEHAISWSAAGTQRSNEKLFTALGNVLEAESQLRADSVMPTETVPPRMKPETFKQLGSPTADAEELLTVEAIDADKLRSAASAARAAIDEQLVADTVQDRQPSEPAPLNAQLVGLRIEVRLRCHLTPTPAASNLHIYIWCEAVVEKVADGTSDTRSERAYKLFAFESAAADPHRDEPESFTWTILHPQKWDKDVQNAWRWAPCELVRVDGCHHTLL